MHYAQLLVIIIVAGISAQWLAARVRIPAIVVLIAAGITLGPATGVIDLHGVDPHELTELIGLGVAIILFEGAMDLRIAEYRQISKGVARLTIAGPPVAWAAGAAAAHYVAGLSWPVAAVLGAILVVTGPTVIIPLLRQARLTKSTASLLKWEGIVNDPVGVLLAVFTFQYFTLTGDEAGVAGVARGLALAVLAAAVLGGLGGWLMGVVFRQGWVPPHLKSPLLMALVMAAYWVGNLVQPEAGLLVVTVMGVVLGNMALPERDRLLQFKEALTVVLVSALFIVIPTQLELTDLTSLDWRAAAFVLVILLVVRPLTVWLVTPWAGVSWRTRLLASWIAPRGIVAAATAGIFGPALVEAGHMDAAQLLPLVFVIIIVTVLAHGFTLAPIAKRLGLASSGPGGVLIVGANPFTRALASTLHKNGVDVLVADGVYQRLTPLKMDDVPTYYGEVMSEHFEHHVDVTHLSYLLSATDNDYYNALVTRSEGHLFGQHRTYLLPTHQESSKEDKRITLQKRSYFAFASAADYPGLAQRLDDGWTVRTTKITKDHPFDKLAERMGERGTDWILLAGVSGTGAVRLHAPDHPYIPGDGWTAVYLAPNAKEAPAGGERGAGTVAGAEAVKAKTIAQRADRTPR